jgi:hypothetical protein
MDVSAAHLSKAVDDMAAELEKTPHLHWAFSMAWAKGHPGYKGIEEGRFAPAREMAEAFLISLGNYDACSLADIAHAALVGRREKRLLEGPLTEAEPMKDDAARQKAASSLVDLALRYLSRRRRGESWAAHASDKNQEVIVKSKEESAAELCSSDLDDRPPVFLPLKRASSPLRSPFQVPKAPPGGIDLNGSLRAESIASDLVELLIPDRGRFQPGQSNAKLWEALKDELWHLCRKQTGADRGRYFLVFADRTSLESTARKWPF